MLFQFWGNKMNKKANKMKIKFEEEKTSERLKFFLLASDRHYLRLYDHLQSPNCGENYISFVYINKNNSEVIEPAIKLVVFDIFLFLLKMKCRR